MAHMDDIFDLRALVTKHGDKFEKKAWKEHENLFWILYEENDKYQKLSDSLENLMEVLVARFPKQAKAIMNKTKGGK